MPDIVKPAVVLRIDRRQSHRAIKRRISGQAILRGLSQKQVDQIDFLFRCAEVPISRLDDLRERVIWVLLIEIALQPGVPAVFEASLNFKFSLSVLLERRMSRNMFR